MQSCFGVATLKKTYLLIAYNYRSAFPLLCYYKQRIARLHALNEITGHLVESARNTDGFEVKLVVYDSKPIPVCRSLRHGRVRLPREEGAYFGFKQHASININGHVLGGFLTAGNRGDREAALALALIAGGGVVLADFGYRGKNIAQELADESSTLLITTADAGRQRASISNFRERVETFFSQL